MNELCHARLCGYRGGTRTYRFVKAFLSISGVARSLRHSLATAVVQRFRRSDGDRLVSELLHALGFSSFFTIRVDMSACSIAPALVRSATSLLG